MKDFKEKKTSLLYLLRRGLVVLSILALAFAFAGCGNGNNGNNDLPPPPPPPPPNGPGQPQPPAAPFVQRLTLLNEDLYAYSASGTDMRVGFQGFAIDLDGAFLRMEWNDGRTEYVRLNPNHPEWNNFYTFPPAPDIAGRNRPERFWIRHTSMPSGARSSNSFAIDTVVHLAGFGVSFPGQTWYADQRPDELDDFTAAGTWFWLATATDPNPPTVGTRPVVVNNRPAPGMDFRFVASAPASISDLLSHRGNADDFGQPWHLNDRFVEVTAANVGTSGIPLGIYFIEEFSQGMPFSIDYPLLDFSEAMSPPYRIGVIVGASDPRPVAPAGTPTGPDHRHAVRSVITVREFLYVQNVTLESMDNFRFYDDQFRDAIRDLSGDPGIDGTRHLQRDDIRDEIFRMFDDGNTMLRIHYTHGRSRVISWGQFQANRAWWDNVTGNTGGALRPDGTPWPPGAARPVFHRNMIWESAGALVQDHQDLWRNGLMPNDTWGFTLNYVGRSFVEPGVYVRFTPTAPVYAFTSFPANAVQRRFGDQQTNPSFRQRTTGVAIDQHNLPALGNPDLLRNTGLSEVIWPGTPDNGMPYTRDGRPRTIRQLPGLLDDINNHYTLTGTYTRAGSEPRNRYMTFVSGMFDELNAANQHVIFPAWPAQQWARPDENPTLTNWDLPIAWRGQSTTGVLVDVVANHALLAPVPIRSVRFMINPNAFEIGQLATPTGTMSDLTHATDPSTLASITSIPGTPPLNHVLPGNAPFVVVATRDGRTFPMGHLNNLQAGGSGAGEHVIRWDNHVMPVMAGVQRNLTFRLLATPGDHGTGTAPNIPAGFVFADDVEVLALPMNTFAPEQLTMMEGTHATNTEFTLGAPSVIRNPTGPAPLLPRREIEVSVPVTARHVIESLTLPAIPIRHADYSTAMGSDFLITRNQLLASRSDFAGALSFVTGGVLPQAATITEMGWITGLPLEAPANPAAVTTLVTGTRGPGLATNTELVRGQVYQLFVVVALNSAPAVAPAPPVSAPLSTHTFSSMAAIQAGFGTNVLALTPPVLDHAGAAATITDLQLLATEIVNVFPATVTPVTGSTGRHSITIRYTFLAN